MRLDLAGLTAVDLAALVWFLACWIGYMVFADHVRAPLGLMGATSRHRQAWMERMLERDNRIVDTSLLGAMSRSVVFFAQTSIFILAGLVAMLGAQDRAREVIADLPLAISTAPATWDAKVALLIVIFAFAFFKFTWSMRQFNYLLVLIGAAPLPNRVGLKEGVPIARRGARMSDLAVNHFNIGIRAYYFGLAVLAWFVNPWLFMLASAWVVLVLWRREFRSNTLAALKD